MRHLLLILTMMTALSICSLAAGHKVDEALALRVAAKQFAMLEKLDSKSFNTLQPFIQLTKSTGDTVTYYVVAFSNRPGFVIIPGSTFARPFIAMSSKNVFDTTTIPPPMNFMLQSAERMVLRSIHDGSILSDAPVEQKEWMNLDTLNFNNVALRYNAWEVSPLLTAQWGQGGYYNQKCPYHGPACDNGHAYAGCGPVAMAQVMQYHQYPEKYNWSNMPDIVYATNNDVANLIRDCGEHAGTIYSCLGSATVPSYIDNAMRYSFDYPTARYDELDEKWDVSAAEDKIIDELRGGFPVIFQGRQEWNIFDWHIFVMDGWKNAENNNHHYPAFHINWGWEGLYDDMWFSIWSCDPPGSNGPYNYEQGYIHELALPGKVTLTSPLSNSVHPSKTGLTVNWTSIAKAGEMDSAMIIISVLGLKGQPYNWEDGCYTDTIRGIPNNPGLNTFTFMLRSHDNDTLYEYIRVVAYGKYKYHSGSVPIKISQGEHIQFATPVASTVFQSNMSNLIEWNINPNSSGTYRMRYMRISSYGTGMSDSVFTNYQGTSFNWMVPSNLQGKFYLELERTDFPYERIYSEHFTITPPATLSITQPIANIQYVPGDVMDIRWSSNYPGNVKIKIFQLYNYGNTDTLVIAASTPNDGVYDWPIPVDFEPGNFYALTIEGVGNPQVNTGVSCFTIKAKISMIAPTNAVNWEMTTSHLIRWQDNISENVDIKLYKGASFIRSIALNTPSDGSFDWVVPDDLSAALDYKIRITKTGDETVSVYSSFFIISVHRYVNVTAPDGWSQWQKGMLHKIKWTTNAGTLFDIKLIDLSTTPNTTTIIANNVTWTTSGYSWTPSASLNSFHLYKVKVSSVAYPQAEGISDAFELTDAPVIMVSTPNSTTHWPTATTQTITWSDNLPGFVEILLYNRTNSLMNQVISPSTESDGIYSWYIPQTLIPGNQYYILIRSLEYGTLVQDASVDFEITQGSYILVTSPTTASQWQAGTAHTITWNDNLSGNVRIILRKPSIGIQDTLAASTPSDGSFSWTIPVNQVPATNYNILIESTSSTSISDLSDPFEIYSTIGNFITVISPTADSAWKMGTQHYITWDDNMTGNFLLQLYKNSVFVQTIGSYYNVNSHLWTVPTNLVSGKDYQIKVSSGTTYDFSEKFIIRNADFINYTTTAGFRMGKTTTITWTDNISEPVKIELMHADTALTGDTLYRTIVSSTESDGSYSWTIPTDFPTEIWYKIKISRVGSPALTAQSSHFHIYFPYFTDVVNPEAGNILAKDSSYAIQWNNNFTNGELFRIDLYRNGDSIRQIHNGRLGGYYLWPINILFADLPQGDNYTIRVQCKTMPDVFDFSAPFSIIDCDSLNFSIGSDTTLITTGMIDLIATDGYQFYFWTPVQTSGRIDRVTGSYFNPGNYNVICQAIHEGGCVKRDTLILTVQQPPCLANADFTYEPAQGTGACNTFNFINTDNALENCRMTWNFGDGIILDTLSSAISHQFPGPGQYIVSCTATDTSITGCSVTHVETIQIQQPPIIQMSQTFSSDSGLFISAITGPGNYQIVWKIDSIPVKNILNREGYLSDSLRWVFPENGNYLIELVVYDSLSPACTWSYAEDIVVSTVPPCNKTKGYFSTQPAFGYGTGNRNTFLFKGGVNDEMPCSTFSFDLGDGTIITDTLQFLHEYTDPGMYITSMTITDCASCTFIHYDTLYAYPDLVSGLQPNVTGCDSLVLAATPGMFYYNWNNSSHNDSLIVNANGLYWVFLADGLGFFIEDTTAVTIYTTTPVSMTPFPVVCSNTGSYFLHEGYPYGGAYTGNYVNGQSFNVSAAGSGFFEVGYHLPWLQGCSDTAYQIIEVEPLPVAGPLYLQNITQADSAYYAGDTIYTGTNVNALLPPGPFTIQSGAEVFFKAENRLFMKPGTTIKSGSHVKVAILPLNCSPPTDTPGNGTGDETRGETLASKIYVGPNPTSGITNLYISKGSFDGYHAKILDSRGNKIQELPNLTGQTIHLNLGGYPAGLYVIQLVNGSSSKVIKLVKK